MGVACLAQKLPCVCGPSFPLSFPKALLQAERERQEDQGTIRGDMYTYYQRSKKKVAKQGKNGKRLQSEIVVCCLFVHNAQDPKLFMSAGNLAPSVTKSSRKA